MKKNIIALGSVFILASSVARAEIVLTYEVEREQIHGEQAGEVSLEKLTATLGEDYLAVEQGDSQIIYDFEKREMMIQSAEENLCSTTALYSWPNFLDMELQNRIAIRQILYGGGAEGINSLEPFSEEADLGITTGGISKYAVKDIQEAQGTKYYFEDHQVAYVSLREDSIPKDYRQSFEKLLLYSMPMHPLIRRQALKSSKWIAVYEKIPIDVVGSHEKTTYILKGIETTQEAVLLHRQGCPANANQSTDSHAARLNKIISGVENTSLPLEQDWNEGKQIVDDLVENEDYFEAYLGLFEQHLKYGHNIESKMQQVFPVIGHDPRVVLLIQGMDSSSKEKVAQSIDKLKSIDRTGLSRGYMIDIFLANTLFADGQAGEAIDLFIKVLEHDPLFVGAYNDLALIFNSQYDSVSAWQCWDIARKIVPDHPMLKGVTEHERYLVREYPEFF